MYAIFYQFSSFFYKYDGKISIWAFRKLGQKEYIFYKKISLELYWISCKQHIEFFSAFLKNINNIIHFQLFLDI